MSRIGKKAVRIPEKVEVKLEGQQISVKGPNGKMVLPFCDEVKFEKKDSAIHVTPTKDDLKTRSLWGLSRTLLNNMMVGVTSGFRKNLVFTGVGYKAQVAGNKITLSLGFSHHVDYVLPDGISAKVTGNVIEISGCDRELVGFVAAKIRSFRPPEPYKGKGIKYSDETIIRKAGKTGAKK